MTEIFRGPFKFSPKTLSSVRSVRVTGKPGTPRKRSKFSLMRLSAGFKNFTLFLVYESYEISRRRNQNLKITTKATKFLGDLEITTKSEILR